MQNLYSVFDLYVLRINPVFCGQRFLYNRFSHKRFFFLLYSITPKLDLQCVQKDLKSSINICGRQNQPLILARV